MKRLYMYSVLRVILILTHILMWWQLYEITNTTLTGILSSLRFKWVYKHTSIYFQSSYSYFEVETFCIDFINRKGITVVTISNGNRPKQGCNWSLFGISHNLYRDNSDIFFHYTSHNFLHARTTKTYPFHFTRIRRLTNSRVVQKAF